MRILLTVISFLHLIGLQAAAYYISPNGKDNHAGNRWFVPFRTFERAVSALRPGDTLNIMKGDYFSDSEAIIDIDKSGRENAWIVVKNYLNHKPVLHVKTKYGVRLKSANYVSIEGLQIKPESFYGGNQPVSDAELTGIFLEGSYGAPCRHIKIYNNYVLNFSGAGLLARYYDYLVLSYNKFFRNGIGDNAYGAIYLDHGLNTDEKEIYHNFVQANTLEKNSLPDSGKTLPCKPFLYMRFDSAQAPHRDARTLIHNNIAYTNGGGGILIEQATGVRIVHNTLYKNARQETCDWPEVEIRNCRNIDVQNNIFYPFDEKTASRVVRSDSVRFRNNLNYNTGLYVKGSNDVRTDPQFEDIREKENLFNFRLKGNSPAINAGVDEFLSDIDFEGNQRKIDTHTDLGAVEFANRILPSLKNLKMSAGSKGIASKWTSLYTKDQKMYTIWNEQNESFMVKVYNPLGEVIHEQRELVPGAFSFELDMSGYPSGYYTIVSYNANGSHKDRIEVKSR